LSKDSLAWGYINLSVSILDVRNTSAKSSLLLNLALLKPISIWRVVMGIDNDLGSIHKGRLVNFSGGV